VTGYIWTGGGGVDAHSRNAKTGKSEFVQNKERWIKSKRVSGADTTGSEVVSDQEIRQHRKKNKLRWREGNSGSQ